MLDLVTQLRNLADDARGKGQTALARDLAALADRHDPGAAGQDAPAAGAPAREPAAAVTRPGRAPVYSVTRPDGRRVAVSVPPRNATCGSCGEELPGTEREGFCPSCGRPATGAAAPSLPAGATPSYVVLSRAWYGPVRLRQADRFVDEVLFGCYFPDGGCVYDCAVRWHDLRDGKPPAARLELFDDGWAVLRDFPGVFAGLAALGGGTVTVEAVCALLGRNGFADRTPTEPPASLAGRTEEGEGQGEQGRHLRRTRPRRSRRAGSGDHDPR